MSADEGATVNFITAQRTLHSVGSSIITPIFYLSSACAHHNCIGLLTIPKPSAAPVADRTDKLSISVKDGATNVHWNINNVTSETLTAH